MRASCRLDPAHHRPKPTANWPPTTRQTLEGRLQEEEEEPAKWLRIVLWCGIPAALLGLAGGWWLMRQAMTPVAALTQAAAGIRETNLGARLPASGNGDELDQLHARLQRHARTPGDVLRPHREFTLHASHELKTPLTVMHADVRASCGTSATPPNASAWPASSMKSSASPRSWTA